MVDTNPLTTSLISWWALDEASGTRYDAHGSNDLTDNNTVTSAAGLVGVCAVFDGANAEYLSHADNADLSMGDRHYTIAGWIMFDALSASGDDEVHTLAAKWQAAQPEYLCRYDHAYPRMEWYIADGASLIASVTYSLSATTDTWYFVVAYHDPSANTVGLSVNNGTPQTSSTGGTAPADGTTPFTLGSITLSGGAAELTGKLDEVSIWNKQLSAGERSFLYNGGHGRRYTELVPRRIPASISNHYVV